MLLPWSLSNAKSYFTAIKFEKIHYQLHFIELIVYNDLTYKTPLHLQILRNFGTGEKILSLSLSKNGIWSLATYIQMEKEFWYAQIWWILKRLYVCREGLN